MPKIFIPQKNKILEVTEGINLMQALHQAEIPVASSCHGDGICSMCKMKVMGNISEPDELEKRTLQKNKLENQQVRLSCQIQVHSDLSVETTYW